jgi:hypothetical protein
VDRPWVSVGVALSKLNTAVMGGVVEGVGVGEDVKVGVGVGEDVKVGVGVGEDVKVGVGVIVGVGVDVSVEVVVGAEVGRGIAEGVGVMELIAFGLGLGVAVWIGELEGTVGVGEVEVDDEGQLLEANQTIPTIAIVNIAKIIRSFGQVKSLPAIFTSSVNILNLF